MDESEIEIYDYTDMEQCETARVALGFDGDHPNDDEVCEQFEILLCELQIRLFMFFFATMAKTLSGDPFFRDLEFLAYGADGGEVKFEQVTYTPIE